MTDRERIRQLALTISLGILGSVFIIACPPEEHRPYTPMPEHVTDQAECPAACENLRKLGCEEAAPIDMKKACGRPEDCAAGLVCDRGRCVATCEKFCVDTSNAGVELFPGCLARITACSQVEGCTPRVAR